MKIFGLSGDYSALQKEFKKRKNIAKVVFPLVGHSFIAFIVAALLLAFIAC